MRVSLRLLLVILGACLALSRSSSANAQPKSPAALAIAKGQEALTLFDQGKYDEALAKFQQAEALYHSPVFLLYAGRSLRETGHWVEAIVTLRRVAEENLASAPPSWKQAQADAERERASLEAEIPSVIVTVGGGSPSAQVTIDGTAVTVGERVELDPGQHRIVASEGDRAESQTVTLAPRLSGLRVVIALPPAAVLEAPKPASPTTPGARVKSGLHLPGLLIASGGAAALVAGGVVGVLALGKASATRDGLPQSCDGLTCASARRAEIDPGLTAPRTLGTVADVLFITGGIAVAVGVYLIIIHRDAKPHDATAFSPSLHF